MFIPATVIEQLVRIADALEHISAHLDHAFGLPNADAGLPSITYADDDQAVPEDEH